MKPKVSVIIPIYNVEKYLEKCIRSVMIQSLEDIEIICIDDGSSDSSGKILDSIAMEDQRIKVIHNVNHGYGYTINMGFALAQGEYVGIVESDDCIQEKMYERLYQVARETKVDFVKADCYYCYHNADGRNIKEYHVLSVYPEHYNHRIQTQPDVRLFSWEKYNWVGIYKTEFIRNQHITFNESKGASYQDVGFWFQVFMLSESYFLLEEAYYEYCIDNPNSSVKNKIDTDSMFKEFEFIYEILKEKGKCNTEYEKIWNYYRVIDGENTLPRIRSDLRIKVVERVREVLREAIANQTIPCHYFTDSQVRMFFRLLLEPEEYCARLNDTQSRIVDKVMGFQRIYIYGAGNYGEITLSLLKKENFHNHIVGFMVTNSDGITEKLGLPVYVIDDITEPEQEALVIVAISKNKRVGVVDKILEKGFRHYLLYEEL